jgi:asparagine synthase (glutamine-hydrolysing)
LKTIGLPSSLTQRIGYLGQAISKSESTEDLYNYLTKRFTDLKEILLEENFSSFNLENKSLDNLSPQEWMMVMDALSYLPGDILVKVDRAAMSTSLETRAPFLDGRILDYAYQLQLKDKITKRKGKLILRDILNNYVPSEMIDRPKQGFSIPIDGWLRGSLRSWAEDLLSSTKIKKYGILDPAKISLLWKSHLSGAYNNGERLWTILMLQSWLENRS